MDQERNNPKTKLFLGLAAPHFRSIPRGRDLAIINDIMRGLPLLLQKSVTLALVLCLPSNLIAAGSRVAFNPVPIATANMSLFTPQALMLAPVSSLVPSLEGQRQAEWVRRPATTAALRMNLPEERSTGRHRWVKPTVLMLLSAAALVGPAAFILHQTLRKSSDDVRARAWPIKALFAFYVRYIDRYVQVEGLDNLPVNGPFYVVVNHGYKSGVDVFLLALMIAARAGRVPRILVTGDKRPRTEDFERRGLEYFGIAERVVSANPASLTPAPQSQRLTDRMVSYLQENPRHVWIVCPKGSATADPAEQLKDWRKGVGHSALKSGFPIIPVAFAGLSLDWTPHDVLSSGWHAGTKLKTPAPFSVRIRIGTSVTPKGTAEEIMAVLNSNVKTLMRGMPGLLPENGEDTRLNPPDHQLVLRDGRVLRYRDYGSGTPVFHTHAFQGSALERFPGLNEILRRLRVRLIVPERPGIGQSTPQRDRTLADWRLDFKELKTALLGPSERFRMVGFSAGATYALACADTEGLAALALVSPMGLPRSWSHWRHYSRSTRLRLGTARLNLKNTRDAFDREGRKILSDSDAYFSAYLLHRPDDDRNTLSELEAARLFRENRLEGYEKGGGAVFADLKAVQTPMPVSQESIRALHPLVFHGSTDSDVPIQVGKLLAEWSEGIFFPYPNRAHYLIFTEFETILRKLLMVDHSAMAQGSKHGLVLPLMGA